jgi:hypothetical protein
MSTGPSQVLQVLQHLRGWHDLVSMLVVWVNKIHQDELKLRRLEKVLIRICAQEEYLRMVKDKILCPL